MTTNIEFSTLQDDQLPFLKEMLYEALFVPPGHDPFPLSIIEEPSIKKYISNWGENYGDLAFVASYKSKLVGAIWGRIFLADNPGYGYVDDTTPEISMAVKKEYRNQGIGRQLIEHIAKAYSNMALAQISLSVDKINPAARLYNRNGFVFYMDEGSSITMVKTI